MRRIVTHAGIPAELRKEVDIDLISETTNKHTKVQNNKHNLNSTLPCFKKPFPQTGEHLRQSQAECRRLEGELAVSQLALNTAAAAASSAQAQIVAEQQAATLREADTSRQLQSSTEALVRVSTYNSVCSDPVIAGLCS